MSIEDSSDKNVSSSKRQVLVNSTVTVILFCIPWFSFPKEIIFIFPFAVHFSFSFFDFIYNKYYEHTEYKKEKIKESELSNAIDGDIAEIRTLMSSATCSAEIDYLQNRIISLHKEKDQVSKEKRDRIRRETLEFRENKNSAKERQGNAKNEMEESFHAGISAINEQLNNK